MQKHEPEWLAPLDHLRVGQLHKVFQELHDISSISPTQTLSEEKLVEFLQIVQYKLALIVPGDFMMLPAGWMNSEDSHSVLFLLERIENAWNVLLINTSGEGLRYHPVKCEPPHYLRYKYFFLPFSFDVIAQMKGGTGV